MAALWALDLAFADVVASTSDPRLGAIRMAWWRERLEALDSDGDAPAEPRLRAAKSQLIARGVTGAELSRLEDGWLPLLQPFPWGDESAEGLRFRGRVLFGIGAQILGDAAEDVEVAGGLWSLVDGARHCSDLQSRTFLLARARAEIAELPTSKPPRRVRRLTGLSAMAAHDALRDQPLDLPYYNRGRGLAAIAHYLAGTWPRG